MNAPIKIETGMAIPETRGAGAIYPFGEMEIGESFSLPLTDRITNLRAAAKMFGVRNGKKFTVRTIRDEGVARCWRIA